MREIRFFPEHGIKYPLWESFTDKYAMEPSDFDLSDGLTTRLAAYMDFWSTHLTDRESPDFEWDSAENEQHHWEEGDRLVEQLRLEVKDFAVVKDERY